MPKGQSLHIGLNRISLVHYGPQQELAGCEYDADDMAALAKSHRFKPSILLTEEATASAVKAGILDAAANLRHGDSFFLTYSGHGSQVPDTNGDEPDMQDETWCLWDRQFIDDELFTLWAKFKAGVRIVVLSDSCHSGTVLRVLRVQRGSRVFNITKRSKTRALPRAAQKALAKKHKKLYESIQKRNPKSAQARVKASVLLISGCQDPQESRDGARNGLFTQELLRIANNKAFKGSYRALYNRLVAVMPVDQIPNLYQVGAVDTKFKYRKAFQI